jgi:3-dehydroquinate synthase
LEQGARFHASHGDCVAVGMRAAVEIGERMGTTPAHVAHDARALLDAARMPARGPVAVDEALAAAALDRDKKRRAKELRFVLLDGRGSARLLAVPRGEALSALRRAARGALSR